MQHLLKNVGYENDCIVHQVQEARNGHSSGNLPYKKNTLSTSCEKRACRYRFTIVLLFILSVVVSYSKQNAL